MCCAQKLNCDWASNASLECTLLIITSGRLSFGFDIFFSYFMKRQDATKVSAGYQKMKKKTLYFDETVMSFAQTAAWSQHIYLGLFIRFRYWDSNLCRVHHKIRVMFRFLVNITMDVTVAYGIYVRFKVLKRLKPIEIFATVHAVGWLLINWNERTENWVINIALLSKYIPENRTGYDRIFFSH